MEQKEINQAIHDALGLPRIVKKWKYNYHGINSYGYSSYEHALQDALTHLDRDEISYISEYDEDVLPYNYCGNFEAVASAEKKIKNYHLFMFNLADEVGIDTQRNGRSSCTKWSIEECYKIQSASAEQRARAVLKTLKISIDI